MSSLTDRLYLRWLAGNCPEVTGHRGGLFYKDVEGHGSGGIAVMRPVRSVAVLAGSSRSIAPARRGDPRAGGGCAPAR